MGVHGLWKLIDKAGKPVPVETLEGKVLAIDVSIWLYQLVRGFDSSARPGSNVFLLGLFHRICKLLFYRIKPVFVFDGGVPSLKKKTIAARQRGRRKAQESIEKVRQQLLENLIKQQALGDVLGENVKIPKQFTSKQDELFWLPPEPEERMIEAVEESDSDDEMVTKRYYGDLSSVDINSDEFKKLPAEVRHDILTDLKETRKLNSWARIHLMPEEADDFSSFQMGRLLKRRAVQENLDKTAEELGVRGFTVQDLKNILTEQGVDLSQRIAGDNSTRFIYASNLKLTASESSQKELSENEDDPSELIHPTRLKLSEMSESESEDHDDTLPAVRMMAESDNGGLSQQEILELIRQQKAKTVGTEKDIFDLWRAGTSKQSDFTQEENASSSSKTADPNDSRAARGNVEHNESPKLEPGKLPEDSPRGSPTLPQKDPSANQLQQVSPHKNGAFNSNDAFEKLDESNEGAKPSPSRKTGSPSKTNAESVEVDKNSSVLSEEPKTLQIVINPSESIDDDIFADVFSQNQLGPKIAFSSSSSQPVEIDSSQNPIGEIKSDGENPGSPSNYSNPEIQSICDVSTPSDDSESLLTEEVDNVMENDEDILSLVGNAVSSNLENIIESAVAKTISEATKTTSDHPKSPPNTIKEISGSGNSNPIVSHSIKSNTVDQMERPSSLEIIVNPRQPVDVDDDIFADVFSQPSFPVDSENLSKTDSGENPNFSLPKTHSAKSENSVSPKPEAVSAEKSLEIIVDPYEEPEDDIFADVFSQSSAKLKSPVEKSEGPAPAKSKSLEIVVNPSDALDPDDDMFADVFTESDNSPSKTEGSSRISSPKKSMKPSFWKLVNDIKNTSSTRDLSDIRSDLERENQKLVSEGKREERLSSTITEQITQDAQSLLELFGIPYLVAPMEAEAQCAYLDLTGQTEGTITDDSDIWLFGAKNVYKNFFDQRKFVKQFKASDIFQCYRMSRDDLIMIALLVGSDYTTGLVGVGPVSAIEIVAHCQRSGDTSTPQSRLAKFIRDYHSSNLSRHLMRKLQSLEITEGFPSEEVVKAYLAPIVDESQEKFSWAKPDLARIRVFMRDKFGWDTRKTDKTLVPIFEKFSQNTTQKTIHNYFEWAFDVDEASSVSKRVGNAVEMLTTGVVPSPAKKPRKEGPTRDAPKDRLVSNYTRRKYGRFQKDQELEDEPVLEGSRAARAAAKAILAATRKTKAKPASSESTSVEAGSSNADVSSQRPSVPPVERPTRRRKKDNGTLPSGPSLNDPLSDPTPRPSISGSSAAPTASTNAPAPLPSLSDILCGVESETQSASEAPSLWTPSRDFVSPYAKRKFGRVGQTSSTSGRSSDASSAPPKPKNTFDRIMPSKNPAQIARERAAKKLKEAKQKTQLNKKKPN